jgi:hypothetical protein
MGPAGKSSSISGGAGNLEIAARILWNALAAFEIEYLDVADRQGRPAAFGSTRPVATV